MSDQDSEKCNFEAAITYSKEEGLQLLLPDDIDKDEYVDNGILLLSAIMMRVHEDDDFVEDCLSYMREKTNDFKKG